MLHSDKYGAYEKIAKRDGVIWSPCWAHVRRKFFEASAHELQDGYLDQIKDLCLLERKAWTLSPDERMELRRSNAEPIIDEIIQKTKYELVHGKLLPKSELRKAMCYLMGLSPYLKSYLDHPYARIDNNVAQRAIRPLALGQEALHGQRTP